MNCYGKGVIQAYMDGELSYDTRKEFTKHVDTCKVCQDLLLEISKLNQWENVMLEEETVHSPKEIKIDVDQAWKTFENRTKLENVYYINQKLNRRRNELFTNMNKKSKHFMYTAVAAAGLFTTAMIPQVRVATTIVASYRYVTSNISSCFVYLTQM